MTTPHLRLGINWTRADYLPLTHELLKSGAAGFCEILIDNFLQVPPERLARAFEGWPVALHIMHSQFMERDRTALRSMAARIRGFIQELKPLYVSDHVLRFTVNGRNVTFPPELDYTSQYTQARDGVLAWQEMLGTRLYLENHPSILDTGWEQPGFYARLMEETGAGLLFDVSNAVVAQRNCGLPASTWLPVLEQVEHFHVGGYEPSREPPHITLDTHSQALAADTLEFLGCVLKRLGPRPATLSVERDHNIEDAAWREDLGAVGRLQEALHAA